jgi:hypothetical protein
MAAELGGACREDMPTRVLRRLPGFAVQPLSGYRSEQIVVSGEPHNCSAPKARSCHADLRVFGRVPRRCYEGGKDSGGGSAKVDRADPIERCRLRVDLYDGGAAAGGDPRDLSGWVHDTGGADRQQSVHAPPNGSLHHPEFGPAHAVEVEVSLRYRAYGAVDETAVLPDPDPLFWMLDSVADSEGEFIVFAAVEEDQRFIQVLSVGGRLLDIEWRVSTAGELRRLAAVDVLVAHQLLLRCLRDARGWSTVQAEVTQVFGSIPIGADVEVDYAATGLCICNAMLDRAKRRRQLRLPVQKAAVVRWGEHAVATGDIWRDLHGDVEILVRAEAGRDGWRQGISISASRPVLSTATWLEQSEVKFWPSASESEFSVRARTAGDEIRVTNVYRVGGTAQPWVTRWTENAGFWVLTGSPTLRTYHANYYEVAPPTFDDLVFSVEIRR